MNNTNCINFKKENFNIQQLTRLREDKCYLEKDRETSMKPGNYQTSNYRNCDCEIPDVAELSYSFPASYYRDSYGWTSVDGCNIDNDSKLRNCDKLTNKKNINQLFQRPYLTVPYMGKGIGNVCVETKLKYNEDTYQAKPCNTLADINIDRYTPQIPCIKENIQKLENLIPEESDKNWVRGGQPSRQIIRNKDYLEKCGYTYNGKMWLKP